MASMEGKVIAITGGASGIALELAKLLASRGAKVSIADVQAKGLEEAAASIKAAGSADVFTAEVDVRNIDAVNQWIKDTVAKFGRLDGAANLAGVFKAGEYTIETEDEKIWDFMIGVNLTGMMHCLRAQLPHLQAGASVVNAASILSIQGSPTASAYSASKHGVVGLTRSAAKDVGPKGVRVNCIAPGYIDTPMLRAAQAKPGSGERDRAGGAASVALGRMGQPIEVAKLVAFLLSDEASFISGACYSIDGGWNC